MSTVSVHAFFLFQRKYFCQLCSTYRLPFINFHENEIQQLLFELTKQLVLPFFVLSCVYSFLSSYKLTRLTLVAPLDLFFNFVYFDELEQQIRAKLLFPHKSYKPSKTQHSFPSFCFMQSSNGTPFQG